MKSFLKEEKRAGFFLVNISAGYLSVEFILVGKDGKFDLACARRTTLDRKAGSTVRHTVSYNLKNLFSELLASIGPINHLKLARPNVVCAYMPKVAKTELEQIVVSEKFPFSITPEVLSLAMEKHHKNSMLVDELGYIDRRVVSVSANGYVVDSYLDKKVTEISITAFTSTVGAQVRKSALKAIYSSLSDVSIEETTFAVHLLSFLKRVFHSKSGLVACLLPDSTIIVAFKDGVVYHVENLDYGEHDMIKSIGADLSALPVVTRSYLDLFSQSKLHGRQETAVKEAMLKASQNYCDTVSGRLLESGNGRILSGGVHLLPTSKMGEVVFNLLIQSGVKAETPSSSHLIKILNCEDSSLYRNEKEGLYGSILGAIETADLIV